jgi:hypothetical protein
VASSTRQPDSLLTAGAESNVAKKKKKKFIKLSKRKRKTATTGRGQGQTEDSTFCDLCVVFN